MRSVQYVLLDPTGNLTCLVLDPVTEGERTGITAELMRRCEQVGYLVPPKNQEARGRLQMMGGEFCGNAAMATAAWLAGVDGLREGEETHVPLEVSGAEDILVCRIRREKECWQGTVEMPRILEIGEREIAGHRLTAVRLPGMLHLIRPGKDPDREEMENLLMKAAEQLPDPAIGFLQWDREHGCMTPLVYVRDSGTMVWEQACGSGSSAIAAWTAAKEGRSVHLDIQQPGGVLALDVTTEGKEIRRIELTGKIRIGRPKTIRIP